MSSTQLHIPAALCPDRATATHWEVVLQQQERRQREIDECYDQHDVEPLVEGLNDYLAVADELVDDPVPELSTASVILLAS